MHWLILFVAGLFEIAWAVGLKLSDNFARLDMSIFVAITMAISVYLLAVAMKKLPLGTSYAVWTGIGAVGTVLIGIFFMGEPATLPRLCSLALIITGIISLKLSPA